MRRTFSTTPRSTVGCKRCVSGQERRLLSRRVREGTEGIGIPEGREARVGLGGAGGGGCLLARKQRSGTDFALDRDTPRVRTCAAAGMAGRRFRGACAGEWKGSCDTRGASRGA